MLNALTNSIYFGIELFCISTRVLCFYSVVQPGSMARTITSWVPVIPVITVPYEILPLYLLHLARPSIDVLQIGDVYVLVVRCATPRMPAASFLSYEREKMRHTHDSPSTRIAKMHSHQIDTENKGKTANLLEVLS